MLKIWKQTWKKEDGSGQDSGQEAHSRGLDGDGAPQSQSPAKPPVDNYQLPGPVESGVASEQSFQFSRTAREKRGRGYDTDGRLIKRLRTMEVFSESSSTDAISRHLPEVIDVDEPYISEPAQENHFEASPEHFEKMISQAKLQNTLAVLESENHQVKAIHELLLWACATERDRPNNGIVRRRRVALIVVDALTNATLRVAQLNDMLRLSTGIYTPLHGASMDHLAELICKEIVLITANDFLECLDNGTLAISQIHTMLVDNAFSVKDDESHPLRRVMQDFFPITDKLSRPRIFGIIVPPGGKLSLDISLLKLEHILDARIYGISEPLREDIETLPVKPLELVIFYDPQVKVIDTPLMKQLRTYDPRMSIFRSYFHNAKRALSEVGACACDLVWRRALKEMELEAEIDEPIFEEEDELRPGSEVAIRMAKKKVKSVLKNWSFTMPNLDPSSRGFNVTPKFAKLVQVLKACESQGESFRGIIFVQKRCIAYVLTDLLRTLDDEVGFLRPQTLTGHGASSETLTQSDIIEAFKTNQYNLLIATKYAEDLDIIPSTIVIRFDLFESQISYAYCRARVRSQNGHLVYMAERGSDVDRRILSQIARLDAQMESWVNRVASNPTSAAPLRHLRETVDPYRSDSDEEDDVSAHYIKDPTTSGRIYLQDATTVVYRFVSQLYSSLEGKSHKSEQLFEFEELKDDNGANSVCICTVLLPPGAPITRVSGLPCSTLAQARRSACYQTCLELFERGVLDYKLFPRPSLPTTRPQRTAYISTQMMEELSDREEDESLLPVKSKQQGQTRSSGTRPYPRKKPDFWVNTIPIMRGSLYPTIITPVVGAVSEPGHGGLYSPILLLTRLPLPQIPTIRLFFSGMVGEVHLTRAAAFEVNEDRLHLLYKYTIRVVRYITNKPFVCALEDMPYFFAPLDSSFITPFGSHEKTPALQFPQVVDYISWASVEIAASNAAVTINTQDLKTLTKDTDDAMIQDRSVEFTRRYNVVRIRPDLNPLSKPEDSPRERDYDSLYDFCKAKRRFFEGLRDFKQPLIEVDRSPVVTNYLNPAQRLAADTKQNPAKYLIPELCAKCILPQSVFRTAVLLPSILHRLDDMLLVKELNAKFFNHAIDEQHLHAAVSSPSSSVEFDYERLELLGDAYLKYLSSIYLFVTFPTLREGELHIARQRIISNRSLLRNANRCGVPQYIQSKPFTPRLWIPLNYKLYQRPRALQDSVDDVRKETDNGELPDGKEQFRGSVVETHTQTANILVKPEESQDLSQATDTHPYKTPGKKKILASDLQWLGDKGVADVAEAIIGAAYITGGREVALRVTKALNIPVPHVDRWADFGRKVLAPPPEATAKLRPGSIEAVERIMGHEFNHPHLLAQALTHASVHGSEMTTYERLEFIGDAILDFLVIRHIFDRDSGLSPGALTLLKGAMVSNSALAAVCVWAGLHEHLLFESYPLENNIRAYADDLKTRQKAEYELASQESRLPGQYWVDIEPPKALSDVVESILGAVYVSDNFSPVGAETFFDKVLKPFYDQHITLHTLSHHPTKILFEIFQSQGCQEFEIAKENILLDENNHTVECQVLLHDVVLASATDTSPSAAARKASFLALDAIEGDPGFLTRTCDCRVQSQARRAAKKARKAPSPGNDAEEQLVEDALGSGSDNRLKTLSRI